MIVKTKILTDDHADDLSEKVTEFMRVEGIGEEADLNDISWDVSYTKLGVYYNCFITYSYMKVD